MIDTTQCSICGHEFGYEEWIYLTKGVVYCGTCNPPSKPARIRAAEQEVVRLAKLAILGDVTSVRVDAGLDLERAIRALEKEEGE